jgi:hypothetical protein
VGLGVLIVVITVVGVFDLGGGVDAGDGVDLGPVAALAAVIFETARHAVGLENYKLNNAEYRVAKTGSKRLVPEQLFPFWQPVK